MASRLTVPYGQSSVGKSSLLQTGVLWRLRQVGEGAFEYLAAGRAIAVYHSSWTSDPLTALGIAVVGAAKPC